MVDTTFPIGTLDVDAFGVRNPRIMTDLGWRDANGWFYNRHAFPKLFEIVGYKYGKVGEGEFRVPNMMRSKVEIGAPVVQRLTPPIAANTIAASTIMSYDPGFDRHQLFTVTSAEQGRVGQITRLAEDDRGLHVSMKFDLSDYSRKIKELIDRDFTSKIVSASEMRASLGLSDMDLFPDITAPRGGLKFATSTKEHNMTAQKYKTPAKNIKRKDLRVALRLSGLAAREDALFDVVALVQSVGDNEHIYRLSELKRKDLIAKNVRIHTSGASGICSDYSVDGYSGTHHLVIAGKLEKVDGDAFVIISEIDSSDEPLGEDALRVVTD